MTRLPSPVIGLVAGGSLYVLMVVGGLRLAALALAGGAAAILVGIASRYPGAALGIIIAYTPFQTVLLAWLYKLGGPASLVRDLGYIKDAMALGIGLRMLSDRRERGTPGPGFGWLEYAAGLYVAIATVYLLVPLAIPHSFGDEGWYIRLNAWRIDCLFVLLMLVCKRIAFRRRTIQNLSVAVVAVILVEFGSALWEQFSKTSYSNFFMKTIDLPTYQTAVLHLQPVLAPYGYVIPGTSGGHSFVRIGGFSTNQIELGFLVVVPFALAAQWALETDRGLLKILVPGAAFTTALFTLTRSAILACVVALLVILYVAFERQARGRISVLALLLVGVAIAVPLASGSSAAVRFTSIVHSNSSDDNQQHSDLTHQGYADVASHPLGKGLGANPSTGDRFHTSNATTTENSYLQVATELGVAGMVAFIAMYLSLLYQLARLRRGRGLTGAVGTALLAAGAGLLVGGFFLQIWTDFPIALTFWGLSGALIGSTSPDLQPGPRGSHSSEPSSSNESRLHPHTPRTVAAAGSASGLWSG